MTKGFDFNGKLARLCREAVADAKGNPEAQAEIVERLVNATAFTVAVMCEGQSKPMEMLLAGAEQQLYEAAAQHGPVARMVAAAR
jgi:hypothetical protein